MKTVKLKLPIAIIFFFSTLQYLKTRDVFIQLRMSKKIVIQQLLQIRAMDILQLF